MPACWQGVAEARARSNPERHEHLFKVPLDGAWAGEEFAPSSGFVRPASASRAMCSFVPSSLLRRSSSVRPRCIGSPVQTPRSSRRRADRAVPWLLMAPPEPSALTAPVRCRIAEWAAGREPNACVRAIWVWGVWRAARPKVVSVLSFSSRCARASVSPRVVVSAIAGWVKRFSRTIYLSGRAERRDGRYL
jgi:hypothetical protein